MKVFFLGTFSEKGMSGLMQSSYVARVEAVGDMCEKVGAKLGSLTFLQGKYDAIADVEVDCFADRLESEGYKYDSGNDWYERTWTTNEGKESIREVYQQLENGEWNKLMIGYGDRVFFEEKVGKP